MAEIPRATVLAKVREAGLHSLIYGLGSIAQSAAQFIQIPILTGVLSTAEFGAYSLIQMASAIASAIFYLGMTSAMPRSYFDYEDAEDRKSVFTTALVILLAGAVLQVLAGYALGRRISAALLHTDDFSRHVFLAFLGGALGFINQYFFAYLRFLRKSVTCVILGLLSFCGSTGLTILFIRLNPHDLAGPFMAIVIVQALVCAVLVGLYGRKTFSRRLKKRELSLLLKYGIPTILTSFAVMLIEWSDRVLIERLLSISDVGIYSVGYKLGSLINVLMIAPFVQIWSIMMVEYRMHENNKAFFRRILSYYFVLGALVIVASALFVKEAAPIAIRSGHHDEAIPTIILVMVGYLLYGSTNIVAAGLVYQRKVFIFTLVYYSFAFLKIGMNLIVIPSLGISGAALTTMLVWGTVPIAIYLFARRYFTIEFDFGRLLRLLIISAIPIVYVLFVEPHFHLHIWLKAVAFVLIGLAVLVFCTDAKEKSMISSFSRKLFDRMR